MFHRKMSNSGRKRTIEAKSHVKTEFRRDKTHILVQIFYFFIANTEDFARMQLKNSVNSESTYRGEEKYGW